MRRSVSLFIVVAVLAALSYGVSSYLGKRKFVETDNAYTTGDIINIGSQLDDVILWLGAEEGDYVEQGQELIRLDGGTPKNRLARAQSDLARTVQDVAALKQLVRRKAAEVREEEVRYTLARNEAERRAKLADRGMISKEERDVSALRMDEAKAALETAQQELIEARINAGTMPIAEHPRVLTAGALARGMSSMVNKTRIVAPVAGHIAKRFVSAGDVIKAGRPLLQLVQLDRVWVEANFKETQLRNLRIGQPAKIVSDLYGDEVVYEGTVIGTGTGTGAAFSLLPAQNATGNWLKIVQRVPVRIALNGDMIKTHPLPLGTSLAVTIDTSDRDGPRLTAAPSPRPVDVTATYGYWRAGGQDMVDRIIAENLPNAQVSEPPANAAGH
ncbi:MAG: HlyD family efflux transporter periplasmic adaptor subunit [Porticoccaceae bacterium]|nr:efflux RND transporter periplasmic adaptor subunit [Gammaproteobacteria bacterium]TAL03849.1 MAG: HlyD family efflux transporter periplasmic adaptor subunit [Porticoccaceae bacterium]